MKKENRNNRYYSWSLILYESDFDIMIAIKSHIDCISKYALSPLHYLDTKEDGGIVEPHYHLLITFNTHYSLSSIKRLFGFESNIFGERLVDRFSAFQYLTHNTFDDKVLYTDNVITNDILYYCRSPSLDKEIEKNSVVIELINDLINGMAYKDLVRLYGRDLIINYKSYLRFAYLIAKQDRDCKNVFIAIDDFRDSENQIKGD